jgi:hypothetical protein
MNPRPHPAKFESFIALVLAALGLMLVGATFNVLYRLICAGWSAADFLFNLFFTR